MKRWKEALFALVFVLVAALLLDLCGAALRPDRHGFGAVWKPYLAEPEDSLDYLYLGSSLAYCDVNPGLVYDASGLTGYVLAGPEQTLSITYWYLKEALRTQSPAYVLIEGTAFRFDRYQDYSQVNIDYMPRSLNRLGATFRAVEPELRTGLLFPLYFYHSRWKELPVSEALSALAPGRRDEMKGYTAVEGVTQETGAGPGLRDMPEEAVYQANLANLAEILALCRRAGARPVLVFHPTYSQLSAEARERIRADVAALDPETLFFDWSDAFDEIGLAPGQHLYDTGHLNREGACIFSAWLGCFLTEALNASPRTQTEENAAAWRTVAEYWSLPDENTAAGIAGGGVSDMTVYSHLSMIAFS